MDCQSGTIECNSEGKRSLTGSFVSANEAADVVVITVTYNSAAHIGRLIESLRGEATTCRLRVIVVDNSSADGTVDIVRSHGDVLVAPAGGNVGYAGGINVGMRQAGASAAPVLILNPDLTVDRQCISYLLACQRRTGAGAVVPKILEPDGAIYPSLRREPSLTRALGDAALGSRMPARAGLWSEMVTNPEEYERPHRIDWATGAALLVDADVAQRVGAWDEQFFLYSEETDYFRRIRELGAHVWYEPGASVHHAQGGSGSSPELASLLTVNRIRYVRKHHGRGAAAVYRAAVALHELVRSYMPAHRQALHHVLSEPSWIDLPHAQRDLRPSPGSIRGAVIIPAHNEAGVIRRTLNSLGTLPEARDLDVIVAANGCSDDTAALAREVPGVQVLEIVEPSKSIALNTADQATNRYPRIYLDADVQMSPSALADTIEALSDESVLAARPPYKWDLGGASWLVRRYYGARSRIPSVQTHLWGAGVYGLSELGRTRFDAFPTVTADDLFVDQQFANHERRIVTTDPVCVRVPRTAKALLAVLRRQSRGTVELGKRTSSGTVRELMQTITGPIALLDAAVYVSFALLCRFQSRSVGGGWERDDSSRQLDPSSEEQTR